MQQLLEHVPSHLEAKLVDVRDSADFSFLDDAPYDGLWYWDLNNPGHEYISSDFYEALGFESGGKKHASSEWVQLIFPQDRLMKLAKAAKEIGNSAYPYDRIVQYRKKSGEPVAVRCRGVAFLKDGRPHRMLGTKVFVPDSKKSIFEQHIKLMLHLSGDAIISWTEETGVETWNKGAETAYGQKAADAKGKNPFEVSGAVLPMPWEEIKAHLSTGEDWIGEIPHQCADRPTIVTLSRISATKMNDGRVLYLKISRDETDRLEEQKRATIMLTELRHRVRNLFAVVQSIARISARSATNIGPFVEALQGRISALAAAHTAGMGDANDDTGPAPLSTVLKSVLQPYTGLALTLEEPDDDIIVSEIALTPLSLLINELATNAAKHGGWSFPDGHVHLKWQETTMDGETAVKLEWTERIPEQAKSTGGDTARTHHGFGTLLIENSAKQLGGVFERTHNGNRLCITLTFRP